VGVLGRVLDAACGSFYVYLWCLAESSLQVRRGVWGVNRTWGDLVSGFGG
jgi:hypothetical protein